MSQETTSDVSRRKFLITSGVASAGVVGLAGCSERNSGGSDGESGGESGEEMTEMTEGSQDTQLSGDISITGSSTVFPLATAVAEQFQNDNPEVNIDIQSTGSGGGFENFFCPGDSDINNASRPIKDSEMQNCTDNGVQPHEIKVATDALTVVINNGNDWATEMTFDQLEQIWGPEAGEDQTWSDIDSSWPDETIQRFGAAETSGTFDYFTETVNGEEGAHTQAYEPTENDRTIAQGVQGSQYAIGYFGFSYFFNNQDAITAVSIDGGDGPVEPSLQTASNDEYPLARPLFTYPNENRLSEDHIAEFVRFFVEQSTNEEIVANQVGYVPNTQELADTELEELNSVIEQMN